MPPKVPEKCGEMVTYKNQKHEDPKMQAKAKSPKSHATEMTNQNVGIRQ